MPQYDYGLHLVRGHDMSPGAVQAKTDEELRNWHALEHTADQDHDHDEVDY